MAAILAWSAAEVAAWRQHLDRHPPGDYRTQWLLAQLLSMFANDSKNPDRQISPFEFAPWLEVWGQREKRLVGARKARRQRLAARIDQAYQQNSEA